MASGTAFSTCDAYCLRWKEVIWIKGKDISDRMPSIVSSLGIKDLRTTLSFVVV